MITDFGFPVTKGRVSGGNAKSLSWAASQRP